MSSEQSGAAAVDASAGVAPRLLTPNFILWRDGLNGVGEAEAFVEKYLNSMVASQSDLQLLDDLADAEKLLREGPKEQQLLLLFASPLKVLTSGMKDGVSPTEILERWAARARAVLGVVRRNRSRAMILAPEMVVAHPKALFSVLAPFLSKTELPGAPVMDDAPTDPILILIADHALSQDQSMQNLADEVDASALDLSGKGMLWHEVDRDTAFRLYRELSQRQERATQQVSEMRVSNALLTDNNYELQNLIQRLQADLRNTRLTTEQLARIEQQLTQTKADAEQAHADLRAAKREAGASAEENALLIKQLHEMQACILTLQTELDRVYGSRSFRFTAPLRDIRAFVSGHRR